MPLPIDLPGTLAQTWTELMQILAAQGYDIVAIEQGAVQITTQQELIEYLKQFGIEPVYTISETLSGFAQVSAVDPANTTAVTVGTGTAVTVAQGAAQEFTMNGGTTWGIVKKGIAITAALALMISTLDATMLTDLFRDQLDETATPFTIDGENIPVQISSDGKTYYNVDFLEAIREKLIELGVFSQTGIEKTDVSGLYYNQIPDSIFPIELVPANTEMQFASGANPQLTANQWHVRGNKPAMRFDYYYQNSNRFQEVIFASDSQDIIFEGAWGNNALTPQSFTYQTFTAGNKTVYYVVNAKWLYRSTDISLYSIPMPTFELNSSSALSNNTMGTLAWLMVYGDTSEAVEGVTPKESLMLNGIADITKKIYEVIPDWGTPVQTATPTDEDLTEQTDWYPVNTNDVDGLTDGLTEDQTEDATDGEPDADSRDEIIDRLQEMIDILLRDPDKPNQPVIPEIEVGDSGDTPPAEPDLISGSANGLWKIYNPLLSEIEAFGSWLWSSSIIDQITRMFNSPIDAVIALHQIYCTPVRGGSATIKCGFLDSGCSSTYTVVNQYQTINCGQVEIKEFYGTAIDYIATKISIYLPFIGIVPLSASVVMGSILEVIYRIDVLTGTCLAQIKVIKQNSNAVMYAFEGNCACQIPLTATTYTGMVSALVNGVQAGLSLFMGDVVSAAGEIGGAIASPFQGLSGTKQSGSLGANAGALGIRIPYVIITHPTAYDAYLYNEQYGFPANKTVVLGYTSGYTRVKSVHLSGIPCTDDELEQIERLLKEGVIIN